MSLRDSLAPFFGEPMKAEPFFNANYNGSNYSAPLNTSANPESIENKIMGEFLKAGNYKVQESGMAKNDVHHELVDFVIKTALKHRKLDRSTTLSQFKTIIDSFRQTVDKSLSVNVGRIIGTDKAPFDIDDINFGPGVPTPNLKALLNNNLNADFYQYMCANMLCYILSLNTTYDLPQQIFSNIKLASPRLYLDNANRYSLKSFFSWIVGDCKKPGHGLSHPDNDIQSRNSTLCFTSYWDLNSDSSVVAEFDSLLDNLKRQKKILPTGMAALHADFLSELHNAFVNVVEKFFVVIMNELGINDTVSGKNFVNNNFDAKTNRFNVAKLANILQSILNNDNLRNTFANSLNDAAVDVFKKSYGQIGTAGIHTDLSDANNDSLNEFCKTVLENWSKLNRDAKNFYMQTVSLHEKENSPKGWSDNLLDFSNSNFNIDKFRCNDANMDRYRVNLKNAKPGLTVFGSTLPFVSKKSFGKVWYTNANGVKVALQNSEWNENILQEIYSKTYVSNYSGTNELYVNLDSGVRMNIPSNYDTVDKKKEWSFDHVTAMKILIKPKVHKKQQKEEKIMDNETGEIWFGDGESLYQMVNGKKKYYSVDDFGCTERLGIKNTVSDSQCDNLAQCILFNPERLPECLKNLSTSDMFAVGEAEMQKMDPIVAGKLLQIFHVLESKPKFNIKYNTRLIKPMSFKNWMINVVEDNDHTPKGWTQDFKDTLKGNEQLLGYVKGLISFANKNPVILNQDIKLTGVNDESDSQDNESKILEKHGVLHYIQPIENTFESTAFNSAFITQTINSDAFRPMQPLHNPFVNVVVGGGKMFGGVLNCMGGGSMVGGKDKSECAGEKLTRYAKELSKLGVEFENGTAEQLRNMANQLTDLESKCNEMSEVLVLLGKALSHAKCYDDNLGARLSNRKLDLYEIMNNKDLIKFLGDSVKDYEVCLDKSFVKLNQGVETYVKYVNELVSAVTVGKKQVVRHE